jgi:membrane-bound serine protease (ClpP class)
LKIGRIVLLGIVLALCAAPHAAAAPRVLVADFDTDVSPPTASWLVDRIHDAARYDAIVIRLDTPGGLDDSMRKIVKAELASRVPVIVFVAPGGARAASAGVWISQAADLLAMAPNTNIGSSTPISGSGGNLGSDLRRKVVNDAAASLRGLAQTHGRNARWADLAVRKASNLSAQEALRMHVVDVVAPTLPALLETIDGRITKPRHFKLHTAGAELTTQHLGFFTRLLNTLIDPNLLSLLFLAGIGGIIFEVFHPGVVLPGALGAVALVTALYGFAVLPTNWAGFALMVLGVVLLVIDAHVVSHGAITVGGLVALAVGLLMLFHDSPAPFRVNTWFVIALTAAIGGFMAFALGKAVQARRRPSAMPTMVGETGVVRTDTMAFVRGELWQIEPANGEPLRPGDRVEVDDVQGLRLRVHRV